MDTDDITKLMKGRELYQDRARKALPILVRQALAQEPIFYSSLSAEIGMSNPRNLNFVLGTIGFALKELSMEWNEEIPAINCLVVNKETKLPGEGIGFIHDSKEFAKLSRKRQKEILSEEYHKVFMYSRWHDVLKRFGLEYIPNRDYSSLQKAVIARSHESGESPFHKEFKEYVSRNPQILGLPKSIGSGQLEQYLPSGDIVDVLFVNGHQWVVAEVKSKISDTADIYRGIYQCVKYRVLVEAFQAEKGFNPNCRAILVLESEFPRNLVELKNILGVEVIGKVR